MDPERRSFLPAMGSGARGLRFACLLTALLCAGASVPAQDDAEVTQHERNLVRVNRMHKEYLERYGSDTNFMVAKGMLANRHARTLQLWAESTDAGPGEPIEFLLISSDSGHGYESLATSLAAPSDVHKGLEFIGLKPGHPVDSGKLWFWPKGERVAVTFETADREARFVQASAERFIVNRQTGQPLLSGGFVFTGSFETETRSDPPRKAYAADVKAPNSIISIYNEPVTVLDVPVQAPQGGVYGDQILNPQLMLPSNVLVKVTMTPEPWSDGSRLRNLSLDVGVAPDATAGALEDLRFTVREGGTTHVADGGLNDALEYLSGLTRKGFDTFVTVRFGDRIQLGALHKFCTLLASIDTDTGLHVEAPPAGQLYYRAFVPPERFRAREDRIAQPWELHLEDTGHSPTGVLVKIEQVWKDDVIRPELRVSHYSANSPDQLKKALAEHGPGLHVIVVFAPPTLLHGRLMAFLTPILKEYPTVHVFVED